MVACSQWPSEQNVPHSVRVRFLSVTLKELGRRMSCDAAAFVSKLNSPTLVMAIVGNACSNLNMIMLFSPTVGIPRVLGSWYCRVLLLPILHIETETAIYLPTEGGDDIEPSALRSSTRLLTPPPNFTPDRLSPPYFGCVEKLGRARKMLHSVDGRGIEE